MVSANDAHVALEEWALNELRELSRRNFELAKFFFGISAASFALISFFDQRSDIVTLPQIVGFVLIASSIVLAIMMASPAKFELSREIDLADEHRNFAKRTELLRKSWLVVWILGVFLLFVGVSGVLKTVPNIEQDPKVEAVSNA